MLYPLCKVFLRGVECHLGRTARKASGRSAHGVFDTFVHTCNRNLQFRVPKTYLESVANRSQLSRDYHLYVK